MRRRSKYNVVKRHVYIQASDHDDHNSKKLTIVLLKQLVRGLEIPTMASGDKLRQLIEESVTNLRQFLGLTSYYRHFIAHFAKVTAPLRALTC